MTELFDSLAGWTRFTYDFVQYLIAFFSRPKASSDVISGANVGQGGYGTDVLVKLGKFRPNRSRDIRLPHFVANDNDDDAGIRR